MSHFNLKKNKKQKPFPVVKKNYLEHNTKLGNNFFFVIRILFLLKKILIFFNKFYKITYSKVFVSGRTFFFPFFFKIRSDIRRTVTSLEKNNFVLKSIYQYLDYFHYSILNAEIKIGKIKKFVIWFFKSKFKRYKSQKTYKNLAEFSYNYKKDTRELGFNTEINSDFFQIHYDRKFERFFFLKKIVTKNFEVDMHDFFFSSNLKNFFDIKIKINLHFKNKIIRLISIKKKLANLKNGLFFFYGNYINRLYIFQNDKKKLACNQKLSKINSGKYNLFRRKYPKTFCVPIRNNGIYLSFTKKTSDILKLKILSESEFFKHYKHEFKVHYVEKLTSAKSKNFKQKYLNDFFENNELNFLGINVNTSEKKKRGKIFNHRSRIKKNDKKMIKSIFCFRLFDLYNELSTLWEINLKKMTLKRKNKISNKNKFILTFCFKILNLKILYTSFFQKMSIFHLKINKGAEKNKAMKHKFEELKGMEVDFQVFVNYFQKLNNIEKKKIFI